MRHTYQSALVGLAFWLVLSVVGVGSALAHANLERATPASNAILDQSPPQVEILFSEEPEPRFSEIVLFDASGRRVETSALRVLPGEPRTLTVDVPTLADGTYTVSWKTLSAIDGHTAAGAYTFAVGVGQTPGAPTLPVATDVTTTPDWPSAVVRWVTYLATAVLVGALPFMGWIVGPLGRTGPGLFAASRRLALAAAASAVVAGVIGLVVQTMRASGLELADALGAPLLQLLTTRYGLIWAARMLLTVVLALLIWHAPPGGKRQRSFMFVSLLVALGILGSLSLNSHAAAAQTDQTLALTLDGVHLVGMAVWVGGLAHLLMSAVLLVRDGGPSRGPILGRLVSRFSPFATWSVVALVGSGLYQSLIQVGTLEALTMTPYGQSLLWKLGLLMPMLGIGLLNTAIFRPRLAAKAAVENDGPAFKRTQWFRWSVGAEVVFGVLVLAATGLLTTQEPAREVLARMPRVFDVTQRADDLQVRLVVSPPTAGLSAFVVGLQGAGGGQAAAARVTLRFQHLEHDMGENEVTLVPTADGLWSTQGSYLSMVGPWRVVVLVRRDGRDDARTDFDVAAADPTIPSGRSAAPLSVGSTFVGGIVLILVAIALVGRTSRLDRPTVGRAGAAVIAGLGAYLLWTGLTRDVTPTFALTNPIPPSRESLERGQAVYSQNCLACHGPNGRGDGPAGRLLQPPPADLRMHVTAHTEGQLYWWISKGFPGSAMPAFDEQLSEEDRWNVLNFVVQTFGPNGGQP